jgi:hypothetical protein
LRRAEPSVMIHGLLRHIREHRVSATERDHRGFTEENPFVEKCVIGAKPERERDNQSNTDTTQTLNARASEGRACAGDWAASLRTEASEL